MSQAVVRGGHDTFVNSVRPSLEYDGSKYLRLVSGQKRAMLYFRNPAPRGATVTSATIRVYARGASSGSRVLTTSRIAQPWKVRQTTWDNQPTIKADGTTKTIGALADGDPIDLDVTAHLQTMCNGASNFGWRIDTSAGTEHVLYGFDAGDLKPTLTVVWSDAPDEPTSLAPSGGVVATAKPTLQFDYTDVSGNTDLAAVRVQVDAAKSATDPAFDSGPVAATEPELSLSTFNYARTLSVTKTASSTALTGGSFAKADVGATITGTGIPAGATITAIGTTVYDAASDEYRATTATLSANATTSGTVTATITRAYAGVAEGATTYWRVKVQDGGGLWSDWSSWASMKLVSFPTLTITNPPVSGLITERTPPITWTFSGQTAWQVRILDNDDKEIYDSGKRNGTTTSHTVPADVLKKGTGPWRLNVRAWDGEKNRVRTPGNAIFASAWRDTSLTSDGTVTVPSTPTVAQVGVTPWVDVTWTRATMPDAWDIYRDGEPVSGGVDVTASDLFVSGTTYRFRDYTADPNVAHAYQVVANVNGKNSGKSPVSAAVTTSPEGIWLVDLDRGINVTLYGNDTGTWELEDSANTYQPVGSTEIVRVVTGMSGLRGSLSGVLSDGFGKTFAAMEADLYSIKSRPTQTVRLIVGDMNLRVLIGDVKVSPMPYTRNGQRFKDVSFSFWQKGDLPFTPRI